MSRYALGIMVSTEALHAVLLEHTEEGPVVQFKTSFFQSEGEDADLPYAGPEEDPSGLEDEPDDVTIQFGDNGGSEDLFMGSEFDEVDETGDEFGASADAPGTWNFQAALDDLLDECAERGYEDPEIAFCTTTSEVDEVELRLPPDEREEQSEGERGLPLPASRTALLEMLDEQYEGEADEERVGFVPMHRTGDGHQRVLALVTRPGGPVLSTLSTMQTQTLARTPRARLLDTEISLYLGLARSVLQLPPDTPEKTILVRSGPDDTLVLFIEGNTLRQAEHLPELTSEDAAETICSRVLLLQDEYGMGEVQHVMLVAEENEGVLADAFKSYFASASLRLLRTHLPNGEEAEYAGYVAATGAALRLLDEPEYEPFFQSLNLLPKRYTASRFRLPVGWSVPVLLGLLAVTTLGFVWYYLSNARTINERQNELRSLKRQVDDVNPQVLRRRIDSFRTATAQYTEGLQVINRLLKGSNKWSKQLAAVTGRITDIEGVSISQWSPRSNFEVSLRGRSTARPRVVRLARELEGEIRSLSFTEVRDVPLYDFEITVPLDTTKPEAIAYWRKQQRRQLASSSASSPLPASDSAVPSPADTSRDGVARADTGAQRQSDLTAASSSSMADGQSSDSDAWTVVVASLAENEAAQQVAKTYRDRLSETEYAVQVQYSPDNGRYRVGIGAFPSFEDARSVLRKMEDSLPTNAWLHRYSPDSETAAAPTSTLLRKGARMGH